MAYIMPFVDMKRSQIPFLGMPTGNQALSAIYVQASEEHAQYFEFSAATYLFPEIQ